MVGEKFDARRVGTTGQTWSNWAGLQQCRPRDFVKVSGVGELAEIVGTAGAAGRQITTVGSGHSFTPTALSPLGKFIGFAVRFESIEKGVLDVRDMFYFVSVTAIFLFSNITVVECRRLK